MLMAQSARLIWQCYWLLGLGKLRFWSDDEMRKYFQSRHITVVIALLVVASVAYAGVTIMRGSHALTGNIYVATSGSDSNAGTQASPFRTIGKAASVASPGAIVHVGPGTYGYTETTSSGSSGAPITYISDTKWGAKISAPGSTNAWTNTGSWVIIQNFEIADSRYSGIMSTSSNGKFIGNYIHHMVPPDCSRGGAGIELQNYSGTNNDSIGNVIKDIIVSGDCARIHGIYYQGPNGGRIMNNIVSNTSGWGIHLYHNANHVIITNNTAFQNVKGGFLIGGSLEGNDISPGIDSGTVISNNISAFNQGTGIEENGRAAGNTITNNITYGNGSTAIYTRPSISGIPATVPTGNISADPQFVNYLANGSGDYHLKSTSPAIDKGTTLNAPSTDLDGNTRPKGAAFDIGAYEFGSVVTPPPPPPSPGTTSVNDAPVGTGLNQFEFVGAWAASAGTGMFQGDNNYSNTTGDYYQVRFTGNKAAIYSEKGPNLGILGVSIDGGVETIVDVYGVARADQQLLYTSPALSLTTHTLKVRITGNKNAASTGMYAVADRVDVTVSATSKLPGDVDGDNRVNAIDLSALLSHDGQNYPAADFNADGTVGAADMAILMSNWTW